MLLAHLALSRPVSDQIGEALSNKDADDDDEQFEDEQARGPLQPVPVEQRASLRRRIAHRPKHCPKPPPKREGA